MKLEAIFTREKVNINIDWIVWKEKKSVMDDSSAEEYYILKSWTRMDMIFTLLYRRRLSEKIPTC